MNLTNGSVRRIPFTSKEILIYSNDTFLGQFALHGQSASHWVSSAMQRDVQSWLEQFAWHSFASSIQSDWHWIEIDKSLKLSL